MLWQAVVHVSSGKHVIICEGCMLTKIKFVKDAAGRDHGTSKREFRARMKVLVDTQTARWAYMFEKIETELWK